jgi:hypothetical protein
MNMSGGHSRKHSLSKDKDKDYYHSDGYHYDNSIIKNNKEYKLEKIWRSEKNDYARDSKGEIFPFPKKGSKWAGEQTVLNRLNSIDEYLNLKKKYELYEEPKDCLLCDEKNVTTRRYDFMNVMWEDGLKHYIDKHNVEPSTQFKEFILTKEVTNKITTFFRSINKKFKRKDHRVVKNHMNKMIVSRVIKDDKEYVMINRNQMLILDALMIHGGYIKRYLDVKENIGRYSEHAGFLDFEGDTLEKIIVSGKTTRIDEGDDTIYQPTAMEDMYDYEYIFHTHPPTPYPGGRVSDGILYEFPSIGDIYHFIDHHNDGNVIGSLVVTAEGLYNIRKASSGKSDISIDEEALFETYQKIFRKVQKNAITMYGTTFSPREFYSKIAQDTSFIDKLNTSLVQFDIQIDYYPRKKDVFNRWIIDTVFLVFRENK